MPIFVRLQSGWSSRFDKTGDRFTLTRTVDVPAPEREEGLTLDQAEALLETCKLRGHGRVIS
jgi:hypothetical protein